MNDIESPVYIFNTHAQAEDAIHSLSQSGFDMKKLSLVGKGYHTEEHPLGFYTLGDKIKAWGGTGALWGGAYGDRYDRRVLLMLGSLLCALASTGLALNALSAHGRLVALLSLAALSAGALPAKTRLPRRIP